MTLKTLVTTLILTLAPTLSLAMGDCSTTATELHVMSCAEGSQIDSETGTCVPVASS